MGTWDVFFYTRGFPSIDSDRSRRHVSKLLTFPATIGATLHENSPYSTRNQRLTAEGLRSMTGESVGARANEREGRYRQCQAAEAATDACSCDLSVSFRRSSLPSPPPIAASSFRRKAECARTLDRSSSNLHRRGASRVFPTASRLAATRSPLPIRRRRFSHLFYRARGYLPAARPGRISTQYEGGDEIWTQGSHNICLRDFKSVDHTSALRASPRESGAF